MVYYIHIKNLFAQLGQTSLPQKEKPLPKQRLKLYAVLLFFLF